MRAHLHGGPAVETIRQATWTDRDGVLQRGRITERVRRCTSCGALTVTTTRDGRTWRRTTPALVWTPSGAFWPAPE